MLPCSGSWAFSQSLGDAVHCGAHLDIKLLQPRGCTRAEQCGHGNPSRFAVLWGWGSPSLHGFSSFSCLKFPFTEMYSCPQSLWVKRVLSHPQSCFSLFWLVIITEILLYLMWPDGEKQHSQDSSSLSPPPPNASETFKRGQTYGPCVQRGYGFGSRHLSDILQNGFYCCFSLNEILINVAEKDESPGCSFAL